MSIAELSTAALRLLDGPPENRPEWLAEYLSNREFDDWSYETLKEALRFIAYPYPDELGCDINDRANEFSFISKTKAHDIYEAINWLKLDLVRRPDYYFIRALQQHARDVDQMPDPLFNLLCAAQRTEAREIYIEIEALLTDQLRLEPEPTLDFYESGQTVGIGSLKAYMERYSHEEGAAKLLEELR